MPCLRCLKNADLVNADLENIVCVLIEKFHPFILNGRKKIYLVTQHCL